MYISSVGALLLLSFTYGSLEKKKERFVSYFGVQLLVLLVNKELLQDRRSVKKKDEVTTWWRNNVKYDLSVSGKIKVTARKWHCRTKQFEFDHKRNDDCGKNDRI